VLEDIIAHIVPVHSLPLQLPSQPLQLVSRGADVQERARREIAAVLSQGVQGCQFEQLEQVVQGFHQLLYVH